jgi:heavy metal efflux system protein
MNGIPKRTHIRSESLFGLSFIIIIFDDGSDNDWNRQKVTEKMAEADLPAGVQPSMGTDWSTTGQIYWYVLKSTNPKIDLMDLRSIEDFVVEKEIKSVPDIVDVSPFGGIHREYQVRVDPNKLVSYGLSIGQLEQQLSNNNINAGGNFIETGLQQMNVRAIGLFQSVKDIEQTVLTTKSGTPLRVKDIAEVAQGPKVRLGHEGRAIRREDGVIVDNDDVIFSQVMMRKGADSGPTLDGPNGLHAKVKQLNESILPPGVKLEKMIDRSDLLGFTLNTVMHNLGEGMILVAIILFLFLLNVRAALIVSLTIPFSLLFASIWLGATKVPVNLLSLGALDFGMVVDGAVVMVENIVRHLSRPGDAPRSVGDRIRAAAHEVQRPVFYAIVIIITAYLPIFTLQKVEGRIFHPMAWTVVFALFGALTFSVLVAPVLASLLFRKQIRDWENPVLSLVTRGYRHALTWSVHHRGAMVGVASAAVLVSVYLLTSGVIGSEFLPHLDEGSIWVRGTAPPSTGPTEAAILMNRARIAFASFPEVTQVVSQIGRPDDGTDAVDFCNSEYFVDLKPKEQWRPEFHQNKDELIAAMDQKVRKIPGVIWGFTQPIADDMEEAVSGVKGQLAVKIYGEDLRVLEEKGAEVISALQPVPGVVDVGMFRLIGQPNLNLAVDRDAAARFQVNVEDVQDAIQTAVGGNTISQVLQGEQRYDLVARYLPPYRDTREAIERIRLLSPTGERVSLAQLCTIRMADGASTLYREANSRYIGIKYSVRGRDLGSTVEEGIRKVSQQVKLPPRYSFEWAGEYASQKRSEARLMLIVPLTIFLIFMIIYAAFGSAKWACLHLVNVAVARVGGLLALYITGTYFSVSSGVGFLALFGASVQTGVIMVEYINQLRARGLSPEEAAIEGAVRRLRPIMMTMLVATLGLLPAALSHAIGSDSQRPFAIVIVGGLIVDLLMSTFLLPTFYVWWAKPSDRLPSRAG